jgi:hypothetical protein
MRTGIITGSAVGVAMAAMLAFASAAAADPTIQGRVYYETNYASSNGTWVEVCDMQADGNGVYGLFETNTGTSRVNDGNGSAGGCGNATFGRVNRFRVCEDLSGRPDPCSSWATP